MTTHNRFFGWIDETAQWVDITTTHTMGPDESWTTTTSRGTVRTKAPRPPRPATTLQRHPIPTRETPWAGNLATQKRARK